VQKYSIYSSLSQVLKSFHSVFSQQSSPAPRQTDNLSGEEHIPAPTDAHISDSTDAHTGALTDAHISAPTDAHIGVLTAVAAPSVSIGDASTAATDGAASAPGATVGALTGAVATAASDCLPVELINAVSSAVPEDVRGTPIQQRSHSCPSSPSVCHR
jgi:hypothetical protein